MSSNRIISRRSIIVKSGVDIGTTMDPPHQTCLVCDHFMEQTEHCMKFNARPPARIIAFGCEGFSDDNHVPF